MLDQPPNNPLQRSGHDKVHAPDCLAGVGLSGYAPQMRRAAAERGRYAALKLSAGSLVLTAMSFATAVAAQSPTPDSPSDCGREIRIVHLAPASDYYPRHTECPNGPFNSVVRVLVSASGKPEKVLSISIEQPHIASEGGCTRALVEDTILQSAVFSKPSAACVFTLRFTGKQS